MRYQETVLNLTPILWLQEPLANANGKPPLPFLMPFLHLELQEQQEVDPVYTVSLEGYGVKGKAGYRPPLSIRLTGRDAILLGEKLIAYGKECLRHDRK